MDKLALLILGFDENYVPSAEEISKAFKKAAKLFHPDTVTGSSELFRGLKLAKERLENDISICHSSKPSSQYYSNANYASPKPEPKNNYYEERLKEYIIKYCNLLDNCKIKLKIFEIKNEEETVICKIINDVKKGTAQYKAVYSAPHCEQSHSVMRHLWIHDIVVIKKKGFEMCGCKVKVTYYNNRLSLWLHSFFKC